MIFVIITLLCLVSNICFYLYVPSTVAFFCVTVLAVCFGIYLGSWIQERMKL
jgi:hypothetical protein